MKLHPLYKRLMLLLIVIGPFFWLVFTTDGQRRVDLVLLSLWRGGAAMDVAFAKLREDARESDLRGSFPDVPLSCDAVHPGRGIRSHESVRQSHLHGAHRLFQRGARELCGCLFRRGTANRPEIGLSPALP